MEATYQAAIMAAHDGKDVANLEASALHVLRCKGTTRKISTRLPAGDTCIVPHAVRKHSSHTTWIVFCQRERSYIETCQQLVVLTDTFQDVDASVIGAVRPRLQQEGVCPPIGIHEFLRQCGGQASAYMSQTSSDAFAPHSPGAVAMENHAPGFGGCGRWRAADLSLPPRAVASHARTCTPVCKSNALEEVAQ